jgi:hypothetical protein
VARLLILGGGQRGRQLAAELLQAGHAVRIVPVDAAGTEPFGAELFAGNPNRLGTLRGALDGVTIACWLLGAEHAARLPAFLTSAIDSPLRGLIYEAPPAQALRVQEIARQNAIPAYAIAADPRAPDLWLAEVRARLSLFL